MKTLLIALLLTATLSAQWFTATSFSFGAKYFDSLETADVKFEQFFINHTTPKIYYKLGFYAEQLARWSSDDSTTLAADQGQNIVAGLGYNLLTLGHFFIDGGVSLNYRIGNSDRQSTISISGNTLTVVSQYNDNALAVAADIGMGYAFGSNLTLRLDIFAAPNGSVSLLDVGTQTEIFSDVAYSRVHANLALAYWY